MARNYTAGLLITQEELHDFIEAIPENDVIASGDFFGRFNFGGMINNHQFFESISKAEELLHVIKREFPEKYTKLHLGAPFYWMGMAAYYLHDFQTAIYYMDAALSEDIKNDPKSINAPSRLFLRMEGESDYQAAKQIVQHAQSRIRESLDSYNLLVTKNNNGQIPLGEIQKFLLDPASSSKNVSLRSLASAFITFFIEFDYRYFQLSIRNEPGTIELLLMHLFKGCLLFESLLKNNPKVNISKTGTLEKALSELKDMFGMQEKINIGGNTFQQVLNQANTADDQIQTAILMTGRYRNVLGHNLAWNVNLSSDQYIDAFFFISKSCFHAISVLYRKRALD